MGLMLSQPALKEYFEGREYLFQLLRLAALLHDIGHYPFSHLGENIWTTATEGGIDRYFNEAAEETLFDVAASVSRPGPDAATSHETLTASLVRDGEVQAVVDEYLGPVDSGDGPEAASVVVSRIIDGSYPDLICRDLLSGDLDCDRLDYLIRDSGSAALTYGQVDVPYLIENLLVAEHPTFQQKMLCINKRHGKQAVEHYLIGRYYHYAQFVTHKTIVSAELLLAAGMLELIRLERLPSIEEIKETLGTERFLEFTEPSVWSALYEARRSCASDELVEIVERLMRRDFLKVAWDSTELERCGSPNFLDSLQEVGSKKALAARADVDPSLFCFKKEVLSLVGRAPATESDGGDDSPDPWRKSVKLADPERKIPELLASQDGLIHELSLREWVTRRVFVREEPRAEKDQRTIVEALRTELADRELSFEPEPEA